MSEAFDSIMAGLKDALAYAQGDTSRGIAHHFEVQDVDVANIRASTGLSQQRFADSIGVAKATLLNWEQGRRRPTGPARVLLAMIERKPSVVGDLLRVKPPRVRRVPAPASASGRPAPALPRSAA